MDSVNNPARDRVIMASVKLGGWLSAALDDPNVCEEMKEDIRVWFSAGEPVEGWCAYIASDAPFYIQFARDVLEGRLGRIDMDLVDPDWQPSRQHIITACKSMGTALECLEKTKIGGGMPAAEPLRLP